MRRLSETIVVVKKLLWVCVCCLVYPACQAKVKVKTKQSYYIYIYIYIFSILLFVITNKKLFQLNSQVHNIHIRYKDNLHLSSTGLTLVQKGVAYSGCKIYNHLPPQIKKISNNVALFKTMLKKFLLQYVFYSVDEYYQQNYNDYDC